MENIEAEYDNEKDRIHNIGPDENDEAAMIDKIVIDIESNAAKADTIETTWVGNGENSGPNDRPK